MPADSLGSSISTFLNKTDQVTQKYNAAKIESEMTSAGDRLGRATSVARATSVSRQFEPASASSTTFMRAGSVARGFEPVSSRDPFYSQINRVAVVVHLLLVQNLTLILMVTIEKLSSSFIITNYYLPNRRGSRQAWCRAATPRRPTGAQRGR